MAITITNILNTNSAVAATSYATASWTPLPNELYFAAFVSRTGITVDPTIPTASGNGITWVMIDTALYDDSSSSRRRLTLFRGMSASPTTGALTFDEVGQSQTNAFWVVDGVTGMDTSGTSGSGAIVQSAKAIDVVGAASLTATLAAFSSVNNSTYGAIGFTTAGAAVTAGTGFTKLGDNNDSSSTRIATEWRVDNDTTVDFSPDGTQQIAIIAVEIKAAVAASANSGFFALMG